MGKWECWDQRHPDKIDTYGDEDSPEEAAFGFVGSVFDTDPFILHEEKPDQIDVVVKRIEDGQQWKVRVRLDWSVKLNSKQKLAAVPQSTSEPKDTK